MLSVISNNTMNLGSLCALSKLVKYITTDTIREEPLPREKIEKYFGKLPFHKDAVQYNEGYSTFDANKKDSDKQTKETLETLETLETPKNKTYKRFIDESIFGKMNSRSD